MCKHTDTHTYIRFVCAKKRKHFIQLHFSSKLKTANEKLWLPVGRSFGRSVEGLCVVIIPTVFATGGAQGPDMKYVTKYTSNSFFNLVGGLFFLVILLLHVCVHINSTFRTVVQEGDKGGGWSWYMEYRQYNSNCNDISTCWGRVAPLADMRFMAKEKFLLKNA